MVNLLKGDILATTGPSLTLMVGVFGVVVLVLFAFRKELLLVSFDRDLAVVFGKRAGLWDILLYLLIGVVDLARRDDGRADGRPSASWSCRRYGALDHATHADLLARLGGARRP